MFADNSRMKFSTVFYGVFIFFVGSAGAFAADNADQENGVKVNGVVFNISKDRKIEKVGGVYNPEGLDKYVDRKVTEMTERLQKIEAQIDESNKKLDKLTEQISLLSSKDLVSQSAQDKPKT